MSLVHKYRPNKIEDVIGQSFVKSAIAGMFKRGVLHPVLIFHGDRGCGKTTLARIVANHFASNELDIVEIDAASNNGVDFVRDLVGQTQFASIGGGYKIYIIDEAHQLTKQANNALLKTLEEPGQKTAFIFCTTEVQKILPTVKSRAQTFKFSPVSTGDVLLKLKTVCQQEQLEISDDVLSAIAQSNNGIVRESLTDLDQISLIANPTLSQYMGMKGKSEITVITDILNSVLSSDYLKLRQSLKSASDPIELLSELSNFLSNVIPAKSKTFELQTCDRATFIKAGEWGKDKPDAQIIAMLIHLQRASLSFDAVKNPRVYLESVLLDLFNKPPVVEPQQTPQDPISVLKSDDDIAAILGKVSASYSDNTLLITLPPQFVQHKGYVSAKFADAIARFNLNCKLSVTP